MFNDSGVFAALRQSLATLVWLRADAVRIASVDVAET